MNERKIIEVLNYTRDLLFALGEGNNEIIEELEEVIVELEDKWKEELKIQDDEEDY